MVTLYKVDTFAFQGWLTGTWSFTVALYGRPGFLDGPIDMHIYSFN